MNHNNLHSFCACLFAVVLVPGWAIAQDQTAEDQPPKPPKIEPAKDQPDPEQPAVTITPSGQASESQPSPAVTDQTFQPAPTASVSAVSRLLAANKDYQKGDLLTWELVKPVLDRLRRARVPMPPQKELKARFLSRNDPLVRMLGTERGKEFFQELRKNPSSIDRVDHYRSLPRGEQFLQEFIRDVDGYKFFTTKTWLDEYDAKWAEQRTLANVPGGKQFGEPTGRIYTERQLIAFLAEYKKTGGTRSYE